MSARSRFAVLVMSVLAVLAALATPAGAATDSSSSGGTVWLCRPGLANNPCAPDLTTTVYDNQGHVTGVDHVQRATNAQIDCFYVYPTVSDEPTSQADFTIDPVLRSIALYQAARYSSECNVYAPVYRQITLKAITGAPVTPEMRETAYQDVRHAFLDYLANDNHGHGIVFISHSQGTGDLRRLLREEVDPNPAVRDKLVSAILLGGNVTVKKGQDVGGDFQHIPACRAERQTGCVIAFSTFDQPVPAGSLFGRTADPSLEVLCTNPAALAGGAGPLDTIEPTEPFAPGTISAVNALLGLAPITATTPFVQYNDAYSARCATSNGANVLEITPLGASPLLHPSPDPTWGLHLVDANIALGNLVGLVRVEGINWVRDQRGICAWQCFPRHF